MIKGVDADDEVEWQGDKGLIKSVLKEVRRNGQRMFVGFEKGSGIN